MCYNALQGVGGLPKWVNLEVTYLLNLEVTYLLNGTFAS